MWRVPFGLSWGRPAADGCRCRVYSLTRRPIVCAASSRLDRVRRITGAAGASAPQIAESVNSLADIASTAARRPTIREAEAVGGVSRGSCNGSHHGIGRTVPFYATVGVSKPLGESPGDSQTRHTVHWQSVGGEHFMTTHAPCILKGPVTLDSPWWARPRSRKRPRRTGIRADLVARVRREIAAGTYDTPQKWDQALDKLSRQLI